MTALIKANMSDMTKLIDVRIKDVVLMASRPNGDSRYRHMRIRTIRTGITSEQVRNEDNTVTIKVEIQARQFTARLQGTLDVASGTVKFMTLDQHVSSYLSKHHFTLVGYTPEAQITNLGRRPKGKVA